MQGGRAAVLVVEDEPATRELLGEVLEANGYVVETAADGAAALTRLAEGGIDIVLLDQMLPHLHGLELCRRLRAAQLDVYLPLIMLTALTGEPHRRAATEVGVDVYLTKPVALDELLYSVGRWAQRAFRNGMLIS